MTYIIVSNSVKLNSSPLNRNETLANGNLIKSGTMQIGIQDDTKGFVKNVQFKFEVLPTDDTTVVTAALNAAAQQAFNTFVA